MSHRRKFDEASSDKTGQLMRALFSQYIEANEEWLASTIVLSENQNETELTGGRFAWLTKAESKPNIQFVVVCVFMFSVEVVVKSN